MSLTTLMIIAMVELIIYFLIGFLIIKLIVSAVEDFLK